MCSAIGGARRAHAAVAMSSFPGSRCPSGGRGAPAPPFEVTRMSDAFIVCSNLSFSWPDDTPVFPDLSFTVGAGRTGLVAPNGAGKSTLLRLIAGELRPSGGSVTVDGVLGYLPQTLPLVGDLTVAEVLGVAERDRGPARHRVRRRQRGALRHDRRRLGHRGAHPRPAGPARPGRAVARPAAATPSAAARSVSLGLAAQLLQAARRAAARRADQQPRPGGPAQALRRAGGLVRLPAAGQPRPGAAGPDGPHRRTGPRARSAVRRQLHRVHRGRAGRAGGRGEATSATPSRRSSGRSGRCSRPASGPTGGPATPPATSRTPACRGSSPGA